ncbi:MAG: hypothetical protein OIN90_11495 [Candidatus Methanoperedens sp.]|uniref:hypothetical protein n=1 Tax=Candidatus Methanoperedens sp. BLZ2 TaxID=2035255 RepID=UPI0020D0B8E7|nr:hypothetical protein [Candidatus Methanoperedens sp. BLZ2]MCX9079708.1 hypothetical protein [Candidatus Methanoperedens sp.]MCX9088172.1 hypothetical protein [Candidatus Methanoperedens sp.]
MVIQNIVASAELGDDLNLKFDPKVVLLLFGSGKLVITGGKSPEDCENALLRIRNILFNLNLLSHP